MTPLTKIQRSFLIDCGFTGLKITNRNDAYPIQATSSSGFVYGRHTIHTAISKGFVEERDGILHLTKRGYTILPAQVAHIILAIDNLIRALEKMK